MLKQTSAPTTSGSHGAVKFTGRTIPRHKMVARTVTLKHSEWNRSRITASRLHRRLAPDQPSLRVPVPGIPSIICRYVKFSVHGIHRSPYGCSFSTFVITFLGRAYVRGASWLLKLYWTAVWKPNRAVTQKTLPTPILNPIASKVDIGEMDRVATTIRLSCSSSCVSRLLRTAK
jgi:hypothetical protein